MNVIVVEDHDDFRAVLVTVLAEAGHCVTGLSCAEELAEAGVSAGVDLYIVDVGLPGEDGLSLMARLRALSPSAAVVALSARSATEARIEGYRAGADLYLCKPVDFAELAAAVAALDRRARVAPPKSCLRLLLDAGVAEGAAAGVALSVRESRLLLAFGHAADARLERWQVAEILGIDPDRSARSTLEVAIARLRAKLRAATAIEAPLRARRGFGYELSVRLVVE